METKGGKGDGGESDTEGKGDREGEGWPGGDREKKGEKMKNLKLETFVFVCLCCYEAY